MRIAGAVHAGYAVMRAGIDKAAICKQLNGTLTALDSLAAAQASARADSPLGRVGQTIVGPWGVVIAGSEVQQGSLERTDAQGSANAGEQRGAGCSGVLQQQHLP